MTSDFGGRFVLREESFSHGDLSARLLLPASPEELIDETEFEVDERLPYWAELWPSARALARWVLDEPDLPVAAIELGCGVGLPSLALLHRRVDVLATDYYQDALLFAEENARRNGLGLPRTLLLDWREPRADVQRSPLIVASDVLYEARNGPALLELLPHLVTPAARVIIADPGRTYFPELAGQPAAGPAGGRPRGERTTHAGATGRPQHRLIRRTSRRAWTASIERGSPHRWPDFPLSFRLRGPDLRGPFAI
jgi:predicted nicotinamide N-methyase